MAHNPVKGLMMADENVWEREILNDLCNERDMNLILQVPLPRYNRIDSWYWLFDGNGEFTVKSCYRRLRGESQGDDVGFWKRIWNLHMPGKVLNFLWRACHSVLPTAIELAKKCVDINHACAICNDHVEDANHVLFTCRAARELWQAVGEQSLLNVGEGEDVKEVLKREFMNSSKQRCVMIGIHCWGLWYRRNAWVWERKLLLVYTVRIMVTTMLQEWRRSQEVAAGGEGRVGRQSSGKWTKLPEGWIKINVDAACPQQRNRIGVACVARNDRGAFLGARSSVIEGGHQPREAEALSLYEALHWAHKWRNSRCIFEMDSKIVVYAIHGKHENSNFHTIIDDCISFLKYFKEVLLVFDYRSLNTVAHLLAQAANSMSGPRVWFDIAPEFIRCNLLIDASE